MSDINKIRLIRRIKRYGKCPGINVITLPLFDDGILEIYNFDELKQKYYRDRSNDIHIVGIAVSRAQAVRMVRDIVDEVYNNTGGFDCISYFSS
jgi:hypothetical protein